MSKDLDAQLKELGPEYREMIVRMRKAYEPIELGRPHRNAAAYLMAASIAAVFGLGILMNPFSQPSAKSVGFKAAEKNEFMLAYAKGDDSLQEIIRTQNPDGSWKTDYLTRQNAAVLKRCDRADAQLAYRKAMRNLRTRGIL